MKYYKIKKKNENNTKNLINTLINILFKIYYFIKKNIIFMLNKKKGQLIIISFIQI